MPKFATTQNMFCKDNKLMQAQMDVHYNCCEINLFCLRMIPYVERNLSEFALAQLAVILRKTSKYLVKVVMYNDVF